MAQLGQNERITYTAKNMQSGLEGLIAYVLKPTGERLGPFSVVEFSDVNFKGIYYFDFATNKLTDDFGTYTGVIISPLEGHRAPFKIVYEAISVGELEDIAESVTDSIKLLNKADIEVEISEIEEITVEMSEGV